MAVLILLIVVDSNPLNETSKSELMEGRFLPFPESRIRFVASLMQRTMKEDDDDEDEGSSQQFPANIFENIPRRKFSLSA